MCNRVRGVSKQVLQDKFGRMIITEGGREVDPNALPERPQISFAFDMPIPKLPVLTGIAPNQWRYMQMQYLPREANGNTELQLKLSNLYNARAESVFERFSFRNSIRQRRCIIPLEGFYDYQSRGKRNGREDNQCYYVDLKNGEPVFAAGVWDTCDGIDGFAIITTEANPLMQEIHNKNPRQPLIIEMRDWARWFAPQSDAAIRELLQIYPDGNMQATEFDLTKPQQRGAGNGPLTLF